MKKLSKKQIQMPINYFANTIHDINISVLLFFVCINALLQISRA